MKKRVFLPIVLTLTGCPGGERLGAGEWKPIYIYGENVCFTVKREEVLTRYSLAINNKNYKVITGGEGVSLTYPKTCFTVQLSKGVAYSATYALSNKNYTYSFIIDNEGNVLGLGR